MTELTVHTSGEFRPDQELLLESLRQEIDALLSVINGLEQIIAEIDAEQFGSLALDVAKSEQTFVIRDSSNRSTDRIDEGETYIISQLWVDSFSNAAFDTSAQTVELVASDGELEFLDETDGVRTYRYILPAIGTDTDVTFTWGKFNDVGLTEFLQASLTFRAYAEVPPASSPEITAVNVSNGFVTLDIRWPSAAPYLIYKKFTVSSGSFFVAAFSNEVRENHRVRLHLFNSATTHEIYATDGGSLVTPTITVATTGPINYDLTGYVDFLNVPSTDIPEGGVSRALVSNITQPLGNYSNFTNNPEMSIAGTSFIPALAARLTPTPTATRGSQQVLTRHKITPASEVYLHQAINVGDPTSTGLGNPWGPEYPFQRGLFGVGIAGSGNNNLSEIRKPGQFFLTPEWRGLPDGNAHLVFGLYSDHTGETEYISGLTHNNYNSGWPRLIDSYNGGRNVILMRVKANSSPTNFDGEIQIWHNQDMIYNVSGLGLIQSGTPALTRFEMNCQYNGFNTAAGSSSPERENKIYMSEWAYKAT